MNSNICQVSDTQNERNLSFDYYYGLEAEQYSFYRVPRLLVKDTRFKKLSSDAKLLYGLMLDRMSMSIKNGWFDDNNRAYIIYAVENIMEDFGYSKPTCIKIMKELGCIGLIEKKRRGLGKPDIIYVKNFATVCQADPSEPVREESQPADRTSAEEKTEREADVEAVDLCEEKDFTSRSKKILPLEVKEFYPNYNNKNYNKENYNQSVNPADISTQKDADMTDADADDKTNAYINLIKRNIEYDWLMTENDREYYDELFELICDVVCVKRKTVKINGEDYPYELVRSRFLKLTSEHLEYVVSKMQKTYASISNIRAYLITALYNAPTSCNHYWRQQVTSDMYGEQTLYKEPQKGRTEPEEWQKRA